MSKTSDEDEELAIFLAQSYDMNPDYHWVDEKFLKDNAVVIDHISQAIRNARGVSEFMNVSARINQFTRHYKNHIRDTKAND